MLRANERVYLYRVRTSQAAARALLLDYLDAMNAIALKPRWYNALCANCTTVVRDRVVHAGGKLPLSWRFLASAYSRVVRPGEDYSAIIREGLPMPPLAK